MLKNVKDLVIGIEGPKPIYLCHGGFEELCDTPLSVPSAWRQRNTSTLQPATKHSLDLLIRASPGPRYPNPELGS
jgi:hypothetical protein